MKMRMSSTKTRRMMKVSDVVFPVSPQHCKINHLIIKVWEYQSSTTKDVPFKIKQQQILTNNYNWEKFNIWLDAFHYVNISKITSISEL